MTRAEDAPAETRSPRRPRGRRRIATAVVALAVAGGLWLAGASTLTLGAHTARAQIEARISELTGQPVLVDGRTEFRFLPRPRLSLFDVRVGGAEPGQTLSIDQLHAELDLSDALFGQADIAKLILVRPELSSPDHGAAAPARPAGSSAPDGSPSADEGRAYDEAILYGRSILDRFDGVRNLVLREGAVRGRGAAADLTSVNLTMSWPSRQAPAELSGSFVWNGQPAQIETRLGKPEQFLAGSVSPLRFQLNSPALDIGFDGEGAAGDGLSFDGSLRVSTPSLARASRWMGGARSGVPDFGQMSLETRVVHRPGAKTALDPVRVSLGEETGHGAIEAAFGEDGRPRFSGTLAFPELDLDRFAAGIAPLPRQALDYQRPMTVSFIEDFDLDLRVSADDAGLGTMPLRRLAASVMVSGARATLDIGDSELFGGRAQGRFFLDLAGQRPMAGGRVDLTGVQASELAGVVGLDAIGLTGRADLNAQFEVPATNWAEVLRDNSSTARLRLSQGSLSGLAADLFDAPGERPLTISPTGPAVPFRSLEASFGTRGPYATLDAFRMSSQAGSFEAGGFLSFLDDRVFVEGLFRPAEGSESGNDLFTTSQPVPFRMQGEWPTPTLAVATRPDSQPI